MVKDIPNFRHIQGTNLYRCGSPEEGSDEDFEELLNQANVKIIVDTRTEFERNRIDQAKLDRLHLFFDPDIHCRGHGLALEKRRGKCENEADDIGRRQVIDVMAGKAFTNLMKSRIPWYAKLLLLLLMIVKRITPRGDLWFTQIAVKYAMKPFGILRQYTDTLDMCGGNIVKVLTTLSEPSNSPCLVCCTAGKDRTGVITALVLSVLGFSRDDIVEDYAKSEDGLHSVKGQIRETMYSYGLTSSEFVHAQSETMVQMLEYIDTKYGSVSSYLSCHGFDTDDQAKLRLNMTATDTG